MGGGSSVLTNEAGKSEPATVDIILAMKALGLCKLAQNISANSPSHAELEQRWIQALRIENYNSWILPEDLVKSSESWSQKGYCPLDGGVEAISGIILDISEAVVGPLPFVCFRSMQSVEEFLNAIQRNEATLGESSKDGFIAKNSNLNNLVTQTRSTSAAGVNGNATQSRKLVSLFDQALKRGQDHANGLLICGHSIGGAMASLFAAEIYANYGDCFRLQVVTFGCPKVLDSSVAHRINSFPYKQLSFLNCDDLVACMGPSGESQSTGTKVVSKRIRVGDDSGMSQSFGEEVVAEGGDIPKLRAPSGPLEDPVAPSPASQPVVPKAGAGSSNTESASTIPSTTTTTSTTTSTASSAPINRMSTTEWVVLPSSSQDPVVRPGKASAANNPKYLSRHSLGGRGGYYDTMTKSSHYQAAVSALLDGDKRQSFDAMQDLFMEDRRAASMDKSLSRQIISFVSRTLSNDVSSTLAHT